MFTRRLFPGEQRPGYELLGLLLFLQIATQSYLSLISPQQDSDPTTTLLTTILNPVQANDSTPTKKATTTDLVDLSTTPLTAQSVILDLVDENVLSYIPSGSRRCPL